MGLDHERLTYEYAGRKFRLTDVAGQVVHEIFALRRGSTRDGGTFYPGLSSPTADGGRRANRIAGRR
jgi:hypothetical protein